MIIFGCSLGGFIIAMIAVIVGLLAGGPVGRIKVSATRDGASLEADGGERMIAMLPRLLNVQGAFGIAASLALLGLLLIQKGETRHWRKQSHGFETQLSRRAAGPCADRRQLSRGGRDRAPGRRRQPRTGGRRPAGHQRKDDPCL